MHYYQFNIKSYCADTAHLSNEEDLAYRRLLDLYYDTEKPITQNIPSLSRRLRVGLPELEIVLNEFFTLTENGWVNAHCDRVIFDMNAFVEKQRLNGKQGGRPKKTQALAKHNPEKPTVKPPTTHNPLPITNNKDQKMPPEADASASPEEDHKKTLFDMGVSLLGKHGVSDSQARSFIAKYAKQDEAKLMEVIGYLAVNPKVEPRSYIVATLRDATDPVFKKICERFGHGVKRMDNGKIRAPNGAIFNADGSGGLCI